MIGHGLHVIVNTTLASLSSKYGDLHKKAKHGDRQAAKTLVDKVCSEKINSKALPADAAIVPVVRNSESPEEPGNCLPLIYAEYIANRIGGKVDCSIVQTRKAKHTGASKRDRFFNLAEFGGMVVVGRHYILVDDHITMGGTLNELRRYIEKKGGFIDAVTTLSASPGGTIFRIRDDTYNKLKELDEDGTLEQKLKTNLGFENGFQDLTNSQGYYLTKKTGRDELLSYKRENTGTSVSVKENSERTEEHISPKVVVDLLDEERSKFKNLDTEKITLMFEDGDYLISNSPLSSEVTKFLGKDQLCSAMDGNISVFPRDKVLDSAWKLDAFGELIGIADLPPDLKGRNFGAKLVRLAEFEKQWKTIFGNEATVPISEEKSMQVRYDVHSGQFIVNGEITGEPNLMLDARQNLRVLLESVKQDMSEGNKEDITNSHKFKR